MVNFLKNRKNLNYVLIVLIILLICVIIYISGRKKPIEEQPSKSPQVPELPQEVIDSLTVPNSESSQTEPPELPKEIIDSLTVPK